MEKSFFKSTGTLHYDTNKLVLLIDQGIADYYRSLIPKSHKFNRQMYDAHISIVRKESPPKMSYWGIYENEEVEFTYHPIVRWDETYYWIDVDPNERFKQIRLELGLSECRSYSGKYHITIGNKKILVQTP